MKIFYALFLMVLLGTMQPTFSQTTDVEKNTGNFSGAVTVTNNGVSLVPTFTLGKPAVIFDASVGKRLSFDPQLRFALEGKPWAFIFWWRYKLVNTDKFRMGIGAHPAIIFSTETYMDNGTAKELIHARRYGAFELSPNYYLTKNISVGAYYLYGHCFENDAVKNTHFITLNMGFNSIKLTDQYYVKFVPQFYYLKMDEMHGFYVTSTLAVSRKNLPITVSALINKTIQSDIIGSKNIVWNINLTYTFNTKYATL